MAHTMEDVLFDSAGTQCAAWVLRPEGADASSPVPCVVMAHGFSATRHDGLLPFARRFADGGLGVVCFDYRGFGDSAGSPRQVISVRGQQDDYRAAVRFAARHDWVDPQRIALWGSSFSGGHVVSVAAGNDSIAAVVAQAPFADGVAQLRHAPLRTMPRITLDALLDVAGSLAGQMPRMVAPTGPPGAYAVMTAPEALVGFEAIVGPDSPWRNEVAARVMLQVGSWRPVRDARRVSCPVLVCVCDADETTPPGPAAEIAANAPRGEVVHYPIGHFGIYLGDAQERAAGDQLAFLQRVLTPAAVVAA